MTKLRWVLSGFVTACVLGAAISLWPHAPASAGFAPPVPPAKPTLAQSVAAPIAAPKPAMDLSVEPSVKLFSAAGVPLPRLKPIVESEAAPIIAAKGDSTEGLLAFGLPPKPRARPFISGDLSAADQARYRRIFQYQTAGNIKAANKELYRLSNMRLRGHVLYQRYMHPTAYRTSFEELRNWLDLYADHPGSARIYKLALERAPKDYRDGLKKPASVRGIARLADPTVQIAKRYVSAKQRSASERRAVKDIQYKVRRHVSRGEPTAALKYVRSDKVLARLDNVEEDQLYGLISRGYFQAAKYEQAYQVAAKAALRSGGQVPIAAWMAGLIDFMQEDYAQAALFFELTGASPYVSGWAQSAGSYWAARSHMRAGHHREVKQWLRRAVEHPRTFYGLLAARALGQDLQFNWTVPAFDAMQRAALNDTSAGARALMLEAVGMTHLAEKELIRLNPPPGSALREAILAYAHEAGLASLSMRLGNAMSAADGQLYDAALYPLSPWTPKSGYTLDPALLHAIMRQESRFDPAAKSPSGASGLMQIMPATASYVAGSKQLKSREGRHKLMDPANNLEIGQRYLEKLLGSGAVADDVVDLLIAYNAGPGNLRKWKRRIPSDDPLLFIEGIPAAETRAYVERVLSNYWIYRMRAGQETPTLEALANGKEASYALIRGDRDYEFAQAENLIEPSAGAGGSKPRGGAFRSLGLNR